MSYNKKIKIIYYIDFFLVAVCQLYWGLYYIFHGGFYLPEGAPFYDLLSAVFYSDAVDTMFLGETIIAFVIPAAIPLPILSVIAWAVYSEVTSAATHRLLSLSFLPVTLATAFSVFLGKPFMTFAGAAILIYGIITIVFMIRDLDCFE